MYIGPPGAIQALPFAKPGLDASPERIGQIHQLLSGGRIVDVVAFKRTYVMSWSMLTQAQFSQLQQLLYYGLGNGPYALLDPNQVNYLTPNQSTGTDVLDAATDFTPEAGTVTSSLLNPVGGRRTLAWAAGAVISGKYVLAGTDAVAVCTLGGLGVPVRASTAYSVSLQQMGTGTLATMNTVIRWYTAAGVLISTSSSSTYTVGASMTAKSWAGTSPSNAAYARGGVWIATADATSIVYLDQLQLEQAAAASAWTIGTGVPLVTFAGLTETHDLYPYRDAVATFVEV